MPGDHCYGVSMCHNFQLPDQGELYKKKYTPKTKIKMYVSGIVFFPLTEQHKYIGWYYYTHL